MWWVLKVLVGVIAIVVSQGAVYADSGKPDWSDYKIHSKSFNSDYRSLDLICGGEVRWVSIAYDPQPRKGCGYGNDDGVKFVQFRRGGQLLSALSYPSDSKYYILRNVCTVTSQSCVYSQSSDSLIQKRQTGVYTSDLSVLKGLSKNSKRVFDPSTMGYYYSVTKDPETLQLGRALPGVIGSMAVSSTGRWAVAESVGLGLLRIDMQTLEHRRIGTLYDKDIQFRFSITDDGSFVALSSERSTTAVISVDDTCGDRLSDASSNGFPGYVRACDQNELYLHPGFEQYYATVEPYFIDPSHLLVTVHTRLGFWEVIVTPKSTPSQARMDYIALGDSFSSGEGESSDKFYLPNTNSRPHSCHVSSRSYPYIIEPIPRIEPSQGLGKRLNIACSGAVMKDIIGSDGYGGQGSRTNGLTSQELEALRSRALVNNLQGILPQVDFVKAHSPALVSIGIGGNDAGFMGKLKSCLAPGTCSWAKAGDSRGAVAAEIDALYDKYVAMVYRVRQASPESRIILIGYPKIISELQNANCDLLTGTMLNYDERIFIARSTERLNSTIRSVAAATGVEYISIQDVYGDSKLCGTASTLSMNGVRLGDDFGPSQSLRVIGAESFHPTPKGHSLAAQEIASHLRRDVERTSLRQTSILHENEEYWSEGVDASTASRFVLLDNDSSSISLGSSSFVYEISLKGGIFEPKSKVYLQVEGSTTEYSTDDDGGVSVTLSIPESYTAPVFTVLVKGTSSSGENLTAYALVDTPELTQPVPVSPSAVQVPISAPTTKLRGVRYGASSYKPDTLSSDVALASTPLLKTSADNLPDHSIKSQAKTRGVGVLLILFISALVAAVLLAIALAVRQRLK